MKPRAGCRANCPRKTLCKRFAGWEEDGTWARIEAALQADADTAGEVDWNTHGPPMFRPERYKRRNRIERLMNRRKQFRAVATRYDKLACRYRATVQIADIFIWLCAKPDRRGRAGRNLVDAPERFYPAGVATQWELSDAWVFSSIAGTGPDDGYTLAEIIAHADVINHAIVTEAEFIRAVPRLVAAGLIGARPEIDRYWRTEKGHALYRQRMKRRGLFGWIDAIPPALHKLGQPQDAAWSVPAGTFERATEDYLHRANTTLGRPGVQLKDPGDTP